MIITTLKYIVLKRIQIYIYKQILVFIPKRHRFELNCCNLQLLRLSSFHARNQLLLRSRPLFYRFFLVFFRKEMSFQKSEK
jgi:hypothetical protein